MELGEGENRGRICVTGGTGYVASWMIYRLLDEGYYVHTTIRSHPGKKDVSFLTSLPGASERLQIFNADLSQPESFEEPIKGCTGVFHVAHPIDFEGKEPEEVQTKRAISATIGILQACLESKTVKRVVYTSSAATVVFNGKTDLEILDEETWSDVNFIKANFKEYGAPYFISKTLTEKAALEFAKEKGLDLVTVIPTYIHGPFVCPRVPGSVQTSMAMIFGDLDQYKTIVKNSYVHVDDVARAHIFLLDYPEAKGRYICSAAEITIDKMYELLSARYPEFQIPTMDFAKMVEGSKTPSLSSKKLLDTGFKYKYGLEEMFDGAIECCKQKGFL